MMRLFDWNSRLHQYLEGMARAPFSWGQNDCMLFAAGAVQAMTGIDHAAEFRGRYATARGGQRILRSAGYESHVALAESLFREAQAVAYAREGDLAVVQTEAGLALGVFAGAGIYVVGLSGLAILPRDRAFKALQVI